MAQCVATEGRQQNRLFLSLHQHLIIAVADDPAKRLVQRSLMLRLSEAIHKDEVGVAIHNRITANAVRFLILLLLLEW